MSSNDKETSGGCGAFVKGTYITTDPTNFFVGFGLGGESASPTNSPGVGGVTSSSPLIKGGNGGQGSIQGGAGGGAPTVITIDGSQIPDNALFVVAGGGGAGGSPNCKSHVV